MPGSYGTWLSNSTSTGSPAAALLTRKEQARVRKHQRRAARAPKGSDCKAAEYAMVARLKAREAAQRKDWCEKTSTELARSYEVIRFEKLSIVNMTASAKGTAKAPGRNVRQNRH